MNLPVMNMTADFQGKAATVVAYTGSGVSVMFGLTKDEWQVIGVLGGLAIGIITYLTNVYFKNEHLKIAKLSVKANIEE